MAFLVCGGEAVAIAFPGSDQRMLVCEDCIVELITLDSALSKDGTDFKVLPFKPKHKRKKCQRKRGWGRTHGADSTI